MGNCPHCGRLMETTKNGYLMCKNAKEHPGNMVYVPGRPKEGRLS